MRRRRYLVYSLLLVPILVLGFLYYIKPKDDLGPFRPYIRNEFVEYRMAGHKHPMLLRTRQIELSGLTMDHAHALLKEMYSKEPGWTWDPTAQVATANDSPAMGWVSENIPTMIWQGKLHHENDATPEEVKTHKNDMPSVIYLGEDQVPINDWREKVWARLSNKMVKG